MNEHEAKPPAGEALFNGEALHRTLTCQRCGAAFTCDLSGHCWCMDETVKFPMPAEGEDCLCRDCLRAAAEPPATPSSIPTRR